MTGEDTGGMQANTNFLKTRLTLVTGDFDGFGKLIARNGVLK